MRVPPAGKNTPVLQYNVTEGRPFCSFVPSFRHVEQLSVLSPSGQLQLRHTQTHKHTHITHITHHTHTRKTAQNEGDAPSAGAGECSPDQALFGGRDASHAFVRGAAPKRRGRGGQERGQERGQGEKEVVLRMIALYHNR